MKIFNQRRRINRKGALQLSINAVVILILAITMLGLGLGFIRNLFGGTSEQLTAIAGELNEEQLTSLKASTKEITFPQRITVKSQRKGVNFAIYNNRGTELKLTLDQEVCGTGSEACIACDDMIGNTDALDPSKLVTFNTFETITVNPGGSEVVQLMINIDPNAPPTMYRCYMELKILEGDTGVYAKKRFEIDYKG